MKMANVVYIVQEINSIDMMLDSGAEAVSNFQIFSNIDAAKEYFYQQLNNYYNDGWFDVDTVRAEDNYYEAQLAIIGVDGQFSLMCFEQEVKERCE